MKRLLTAVLAVLTATAALAQPGVQTRGVQVVPQPNRPGQSLDVRVWTDRNEYRVDDTIRVSYRANRDAYVLIFSKDADGKTRQLLPNAYDSDNFVRGGQTYTIPNRGYSLQVTPPKGRETISIVAFSERHQALSHFRANHTDPFPRSKGPKDAIARVIVRPDDNNNRGRYAEDSTTFRVYGRNENMPGHGGGSSHNNSGTLSIDSNPRGAYVYIDGTYRGATPFNAGRVPTGNYDITITRSGYETVRRRVRVDRGENERVYENLRRQGGGNWYGPWRY